MYLWELFDYFDWGNDFSHFFENLDKINLCNILIYSLFLQRSIFTSKTKTFSIYSLSYQVSVHPKLNLSSSFSFPTFFNWNPSTLANLIKTMRVSHIMLVTDLNGCDYSSPLLPQHTLLSTSCLITRLPISMGLSNPLLNHSVIHSNSIIIYHLHL